MSHWKSFAPQFSPFYRNSLFWLIINFHIKRITHRDTKIISKKKIISNKKKKKSPKNISNFTNSFVKNSWHYLATTTTIVKMFHSSSLMNYLPFSCQSFPHVLVQLLSNILYCHVNMHY